MKIVGLIGPKGAGKDAVAKILKDGKVADGKIALAGPLKMLCQNVFNIPLIKFNAPDLKEKAFDVPIVLKPKHFREIRKVMETILPPNEIFYNINKGSIAGLENRELKTPREVLQVIGTDFIRNRLFADWHLHAALSKSQLVKCKPSGIYCVTDIRFLNEYETITNKFGNGVVVYYIERPEAEENLSKSTHPSETGVLELRELVGENNVIKNDGTLKDLANTVNTLKLPESEFSILGSNSNVDSNEDEKNVAMSGRFKFTKSR